MTENDEQGRTGAPKGADFSQKFNSEPKKKAALAAALRANLARRKARERALRDQAPAKHGEDSKTDSEG
ncbi:MAG: hypothetical protein ACXW3V_07960 [Methylocystis sp.]